MKKHSLGKKRILSIIIIFLVVAVGSLTGILAGKYYENNFLAKPSNVPSKEYSEAELKSDDFERAKGLEGKSLDKIVEEQDGAVLLFCLAENKSLATKNYQVKTSGSVLASIANQTVCGSTKVSGNEVFSESLSSGLMSVANKLTSDGAKVILYKGKGVKDVGDGVLEGDYSNNNAISYSVEEYIDTFGGLGGIVNYVVAVSTVKSVDDVVFGNDDNGKYVDITYTLDEKTSSINYRKNVKATSDLKEYPNFSSVVITARISEDFYLTKISVNEVYTIKYTEFLSPECKGNIENIITYG